MTLVRPKRIVCLVPSLTETLVNFGLRDQLVGCTNFCVVPKDLHLTAKLVGGTKDANLQKILALQPTHVLANQEENSKTLIEEIAKHIPTLLTFPKSPRDVPNMLRDIGKFLEQDAVAHRWADAIEAEILKFRSREAKSYLYFIWQNPYMLAGADTYITANLDWLGWHNAYQGKERYPIADIGEIEVLNADLILLSSEPYPFRLRDAIRMQASLAKKMKFAKVDGQELSWYGTRTLHTFQLFNQEKKTWLKMLNLP